MPDGGPDALFEESELESVDLGDGVALGPGYRVAHDVDDDFFEVWGTTFSALYGLARASAAGAGARGGEGAPPDLALMALHVRMNCSTEGSSSGMKLMRPRLSLRCS